MVIDNQSYLKFKNHMYLWTTSGYTECKLFPIAGKSTVLTPKSVVNAFKAGYMPQIKINEENL